MTLHDQVAQRALLGGQPGTTVSEDRVAGFRAALDSARPSLHLLAGRLDQTDDAPTLDAWLETGAALEGRAHPFFRYDPTAGSTWASRLDFSGNPAPEEPPSASPPSGEARNG